jgi:hypothetical protein
VLRQGLICGINGISSIYDDFRRDKGAIVLFRKAGKSFDLAKTEIVQEEEKET